MTPDEYRSGLLRIAAEIAKTVSSLLRVLPADPSDTVWSSFLQSIYPAVLEARRKAYLLSRDFYASQRREHAADDDLPPETLERRYPLSVLDKTLSEATRARLDGGDELDADRDLIERETLTTLERHVMAAGRDAIVDSARQDAAAVGYARVESGAETCAFCTMLVSRGPVYKTRADALFRDGQREPYHNRCDCVAVPVFDRDNWPGREGYLKAEEFYRRTTKKHPNVSPLAALRIELGERKAA